MDSKVFPSSSSIGLSVAEEAPQQEEEEEAEDDKKAEDRRPFRICSGFVSQFWIVVWICVGFYSVLISFSDFATDFYNESWGKQMMEQRPNNREMITRRLLLGYPPQKASRVQSITTITAMLFTPVFGFFGDRCGRRLSFILVGASLLIPAHLFLLIHALPGVSSVLQGLASSMVASSLWPSVPLLGWGPRYLDATGLPRADLSHIVWFPVSEDRLNTAYGLMTAFQNFFLFIVPIFVGEVRVRTGSYRGNVPWIMVANGVS